MATLRGKYMLNANGIKLIENSYDPSNGIAMLNYRDMNGRLYNTIEVENTPGLPGCAIIYLYGLEEKEDGTEVYNNFTLESTVFPEDTAWQILDFGETEQTVSDELYNNALSYFLVPQESNAYMTSGGMSMFINGASANHKERIKNKAKQALPTMQVIKPYQANSSTREATFLSDAKLFLIAIRPSTSSDPVYMSVAVSDLAPGVTMQVDAPDNTMTTRFSVYRRTDGKSFTIKTVACYNQNAASQSQTGQILAIYGLNIGG